MIYVIMCGGTYTEFDYPKQLSVVKGERLVERTIRLLKGAGIQESDIKISSNDERFDEFGVERLENPNNKYKSVDGVTSGYWLDAFWPYFTFGQKVTFLFGDVWFTEEAIRKIVAYPKNFPGNKNVLFGTGLAANALQKNWGEPFAYVVNDYRTFMAGVRVVKALQDEGKLKRKAIVWELYRCLNGLDVNVQQVLVGDTFFIIDDGTIDCDEPARVKELNDR